MMIAADGSGLTGLRTLGVRPASSPVADPPGSRVAPWIADEYAHWMDPSEALDAVREYVAARHMVLWTPGVAVAFTDPHRCLGSVLHGWADLDRGIPIAGHHRFQIGSISKGLTALAILQHAEEGRIDLDAPVTAYLPWFEVQSRFDAITIHHLLSHTSGLVPGTDFTEDAVSEVWSLRETVVGFPPGARFLYSNVGYKTLGLVLQSVAGAPWWETVRDRVMIPIGMGDADVIITARSRERLAVGYAAPYADRPWQARHGWSPAPWFDSATADGSICATAEELTAYARCLLRRGEGVVSPASFERMTTPVARNPSAPDERFGYGVKWVEDEDRRLLGHAGGMVGFSAYLLVDPEASMGVTVLMNSAYGDAGALARFALRCVVESAAGHGLPVIPGDADPHHVEDADGFVGTYEDAAGAIEIAAEGARLFGVVGDGHGGRGVRAALEPVGDGVFGIDDPELELEPITFRREEGVVTSAFWGSRWLRSSATLEHRPASPPSEWGVLTGRYVSWNPWAPSFRVLLRGDELWLSFTGETIDGGGERRLEPLSDGWFRFGDEWSPDRVRFDTVVDGKARRALFDAAPYYRTFAP
jgi:CubicO group peptidase (beta-lactamase class C family)